TTRYGQGGAGGLFRSVDGGTNWTKSSEGIPENTDVFALAAGGTILFAGTTYGVYRSTDSGANWTLVSTDLPNTGVFALAVSGAQLFAGADYLGVLRSIDNRT